MATIAIIGQDGAGKSTISKMIINNSDLKIKYIYMGRNPESGNFNLPTSKLIYFLKIYTYKKKNKIKEYQQAKKISLHELDKDRKIDTRGKIGAFLRLLNRLAEEYYRLVISWSYQLRGYLVLYDRHFIYDNIPDKLDTSEQKNRLTTRIHNWFLNNLYEKPGIIIFLNAPAEILYKRKGEATIKYIRAKNEAFLEYGKQLNNFVIVDASQPVDKVFNDVMNKICTHFKFHKTNFSIKY
jgi:thymidylate kinase